MSRADQQFKLRMPPALRTQVENAAKAAHRSLNAELVLRLEHSFSGEVPAHANPEQLPTPATRRQLRLFCVLVEHSDGTSEIFPVNTLQPVPPRRLHTGQWPLVLPAGLVLRPARTSPASRELLAHGFRLGQADSLPAISGARA